MTNELKTKVKFKKPYFIEELGEDGLTARDIAESLEIPLERVHQKLRKSFIENSKEIEGWVCIENSMVIDLGTYTERAGNSYVLNTRAAKVFVATYNNTIGRRYIDFLFDCEILALEVVPRLYEELQDVKLKLEAAEQEHIKKSKKLTAASKKGMVLAPVYQQTLFGLKLDWEMHHKETLTEMQRLKSKMEHSQKVMEGLISTIRSLQTKIDNQDLSEKNKEWTFKGQLRKFLE